MAKKEEVIVDEEMIRSMIRGDVPASAMRGAGQDGSGESGNAPPEPPAVVRHDETAAGSKRSYAKRKKKEETGSYIEKFCVNDKSRDRVSLKISGELYDRIRRFLPVIAPELNLTSYLNNIISDHLDQNWDEITELYNNEINKPL